MLYSWLFDRQEKWKITFSGFWQIVESLSNQQVIWNILCLKKGVQWGDLLWLDCEIKGTNTVLCMNLITCTNCSNWSLVLKHKHKHLVTHVLTENAHPCIIVMPSLPARYTPSPWWGEATEAKIPTQCLTPTARFKLRLGTLLHLG
jgi:hypothetical protein